MKLLFISSLIFKKNSSAAIRNSALISELKNNCNKIDVLTLDFPESETDEYLIERLKDINIKKFYLKIFNVIYNKEITKTSKIESSSTSRFPVIKKYLKEVFYFPDFDKEWINKIDYLNHTFDYDFIISSSDSKTSHFIGKKIKKKYSNIKWIQIWGDPWLYDVNLKKINYFLKKRIAINEYEMLKSADLIIYVSHPTKTMMQSKFPEFSKKIVYIPRSYLEETTESPNDINNNLEFIFTYSGVINKDRNIIPLLESIKKYNKNHQKKIKLNIIGQIILSEKLTNEILIYDFVNFCGTLRLRELKKELSKSDYLIFIDNGKGSSQIPGKLFDYFGTSKPIIALVSSLEDETSKFIISTKRCIVRENNVFDLEFINNRSDEKPLSDYSPKTISKELLSYINRL